MGGGTWMSGRGPREGEFEGRAASWEWTVPEKAEVLWVSEGEWAWRDITGEGQVEEARVVGR